MEITFNTFIPDDVATDLQNGSTTPLRYLISIDEADILEKLFAGIVIPQAVFDEMQHPKTPQKVKDWLNPPPPLGWKFDRRILRFTHRKSILA